MTIVGRLKNKKKRRRKLTKSSDILNAAAQIPVAGSSQVAFHSPASRRGITQCTFSLFFGPVCLYSSRYIFYHLSRLCSPSSRTYHWPFLVKHRLQLNYTTIHSFFIKSAYLCPSLTNSWSLSLSIRSKPRVWNVVVSVDPAPLNSNRLYYLPLEHLVDTVRLSVFTPRLSCVCI